ncbi:mannose-1-phosphate guanylyltransferase [Chlorobium sp. N1]|uniref:mannose-1-phosphate guanylyltransferase n=1 Tax=Chlorobium sp. N1 TaxID=2491138 RepID=UPI001039457F|nr:mannose-1-phosphate guanylyltransferase [Chlorobium sp. N1]TCD47789.1 mannose-1-phosphate guanyltransferase [Chlorobium sp. N1]
MQRARECGLYAVILAGGSGRALWPMSREGKPGPFLDLLGDGPMIRHTIRRARRITSPEHVLVVTDARGRGLLGECGVRLEKGSLILEPFQRGTAAAIALAAAHVRRRDPEAVLVVLPSDHVILNEEAFEAVLLSAVAEARRKESLVLLGIRPRSPETVYGYIQAGRPLGRPHVGGCTANALYRARSFAEKPDLATAIRFVESGDFYWNSGIFAAHVDVLFEAYRQALPDLYRDMLAIEDAIGTKAEVRVVSEVYSWIHPGSVDAAVMEKVDGIVLLAGEFGWHDPGSWDEVASLVAERRAFAGEGDEPETVRLEGENTFIRKPGGKVVAVIGASELIIVDTPDALLVCAKGESHRIGEALDRLWRERMDEHL